MRKWMFVLLCLLLCGCAGDPEPETTAAPTAITVTEAAVTIPPTTEPATVPTTQPPEPVTLYSGIGEDGRFTHGAVLIGDSLTFNLVRDFLTPNGYLGDARFITVCGAPVSRVLSDAKLGSDPGAAWFTLGYMGRTIGEILEEIGPETKAIYLMLGTNFTGDTDEALYIRVVDFLLETCPEATVYLQTIPYCALDPADPNAAVRVDEDAVNAMLRAAADHYRETGKPRVVLLDTYTAIGPDHLLSDGIHLTIPGMRAWYEYLRNPTNDEADG